jgi:sulfite reductase (NADPH) hemoprotein beta-component
MYKYNDNDVKFVDQRHHQFKKQVTRYFDNELSDDQFRSVRLRNGLYQELHAYMLRVLIPYGTLNSEQLNQLGLIAEKYDRGYGHFTTRQNIQFNWIDLLQINEIIKDLASVDMHAIQSSGKVVRNIAADPLSGIRKDEIADARPYCELIRQWFTLHPEFSWLPGKFKMAINGSEHDEIGIQFNDLGLQLVLNDNDELGFSVYVGGGLGAAPMLAKKIKSFVPEKDILSYLESVLRVYNLFGKRDNDKRLRIKFMVRSLGVENFSDLVERDWISSRDDDEVKLKISQLNKIKKDFLIPIKPITSKNKDKKVDFNYTIWKSNNVSENKVKGYSIVSVSLTQIGSAPGNIDSNQLRHLSVLASKYSLNEIRTTKNQDIIFPYVRNQDLFELWQQLEILDLSSPHNSTFAHIVSCPGADYCSLAKAVSIPVSQRIQNRFIENELLFEVGELNLHISGCENSCAHHHVADIGLLGLNKAKKDYYQITLGGRTKNNTKLGKKLGRAIASVDVVDAVEKIVNVYLNNKQQGENFNQLFNRIGIKLFKEAVYA